MFFLNNIHILQTLTTRDIWQNICRFENPVLLCLTLIAGLKNVGIVGSSARGFKMPLIHGETEIFGFKRKKQRRGWKHKPIFRIS